MSVYHIHLGDDRLGSLWLKMQWRVRISTAGTTRMHASVLPVWTQVWLAVLDLLEQRHFWVQKAAARALGAAFAAPAVAAALHALPHFPGRTALRLFTHFEACGGDAAALTQAVKCLVATAAALYDAEVAANGGALAELGDFRATRAADGGGPMNGSADAGGVGGTWRHGSAGVAAADDPKDAVLRDGGAAARDGGGVDDMDVDSEDGGGEGLGEEGEEEAWEEEEGPGGRRPRALTIRGLFKRMGRHALDRREAVAPLRLAALQWLAAAVRQLGGDRLTAHGGALVAAAARPLHRLQSGAALDGDEVCC